MHKMENAMKVYGSTYLSSYGSGGVVAGEQGLLEVFLPEGTIEDAELRLLRSYPELSGESQVTENAKDLLERYFRGENLTFNFPLDLTQCTPFQQKVYLSVAGIPYGEVRSYAEIAVEAGSPGASRGVGSAMARNRIPIIIPCHRVVGWDGRLTGFSGPGGVEMKKELLLMEGLFVDPRQGRVCIRP